MSKLFSIKISDFVGIFKAIAEKSNINGGDTLEGEEISIFYKTKNSIKTLNRNKSIFTFNNVDYDSDGNECKNLPEVIDKNNLSKNICAENVTFFNYKKIDKENEIAQGKNNKALDSVEQYMKIHKAVSEQINKRRNVAIDDMENGDEKQELLNKIEYITTIILKNSEKYDILELAPVIANIMGIESGGYNFTDGALRNPGRQYKGIMQVDLETCCSIFGQSTTSNVNIGKGRKISSKHKNDNPYAVWHKLHYSQDDDMINELKTKYKTPEALYLAIQDDVELGLEVGILAFKSKLHQSNGNVKKAIKMYCNNQYRVKNDNDFPLIFNV